MLHVDGGGNDARDVQGFIVARYAGDNTRARRRPPNTLCVFAIPRSERNAFATWLAKDLDEASLEAMSPARRKLEGATGAKRQLFERLCAPPGFTRHASRAVLQRIAEAYRTDVNPSTRVGWREVPMVTGSVVLFRGVHMVTGDEGDEACARTVLYLNLRMGTDRTALPKDLDTEIATEGLSDPTQNNAQPEVEVALARHRQARGLAYGFNAASLAAAGVPSGLFVRDDTTPPDREPAAEPTPAMHRLQEEGYVVLPGLLDEAQATNLHRGIVGVTREVTCVIPREGQSAEARAYGQGLSDEALVQQLYTDPRWETMRRYGHGSTAQYAHDDTPDMTDAERARQAKRRKVAQGVKGITKQSGMVPSYKLLAYALALAAVHAELREALGWRALFYGSERCSVRGPGSAPLPPHQDETVVGDARLRFVAEALKLERASGSRQAGLAEALCARLLRRRELRGDAAVEHVRAERRRTMHDLAAAQARDLAAAQARAHAPRTE